MLSFATMLPIIQAREALVAATVVAYGTGSMKKADAQRVHREWQKAATAGRKVGGNKLDFTKMNDRQREMTIKSMGFEIG